MSFLVLPLLVLSQTVGSPESRVAVSEYQAKAESQFSETPRRLEAARRAEFPKRYQELVNAMNAFALKYNSAEGAAWPAKEALAIRKALKRLEDLGPEFQFVK